MSDNEIIDFDELERLENIGFNRRHSTPYPEDNEEIKEGCIVCGKPTAIYLCKDCVGHEAFTQELMQKCIRREFECLMKK